MNSSILQMDLYQNDDSFFKNEQKVVVKQEEDLKQEVELVINHKDQLMVKQEKPEEINDEGNSSSVSDDNSCTKNSKSEVFIKDAPKSKRKSKFQNNLEVNICGVCDKVFKLEMDFTLHVEKYHPNDNAYKCRHCDTIFNSLPELKNHIKTSHIDWSLKYECKICLKNFDTSRKMGHHKRTHENNYCPWCKTEFKLKAELREHQKIHIKKEKKMSKLYNKNIDKNAIKRNITNQLEIDEYQEISNVDTNSNLSNISNSKKHTHHIDSKTNAHLKDQIDNLKNVLDIKEEYFSDSESQNSYDLLDISKTEIQEFIDKDNNSVVKSSAEEKYKCAICSKTYTKIYSLNEHAKKYHPYDKALPCRHCNKLFASLPQLSMHIRKNHTDIIQEKTHFCEICSKGFTESSHLKMHLKTHSEDRPYSCSMCEKKFKVLGRFRWHQKNHFKMDSTRIKLSLHFKRSHQNSKKGVCEICLTTFFRLSDLERHLRNVHNNQRPYSCSLCKKTYKKKKDLRKHTNFFLFNIINKSRSFLQRRQNRKPILKLPQDVGIKCGPCQKSYNFKDLTEHVRQLHPKAKDFKCYHCRIIYPNLTKLSHHIKTHYKDLKINVCKICCKCFEMPSALKLHMRIHAKESPYTCSKCNKTFKLAGNLKQHFRRRHMRDKAVEHKCAVCQQFFPSLRSLDIHGKQLHPKENVFKCQFCNDRFTSLISLQRHNVIHKDKSKQNICEYCKKLFYSKSLLQVHLRMHTGERPFSCTNCEKSYATQQKLNIHLRLHTGECPFPCTMCKKKFPVRESLKRHIKLVHSSEKTQKGGLKCAVCHKVFCRSSNLKQHAKKAHPNENFLSCEHCNELFSGLVPLKRHIKINHTKPMPKKAKKKEIKHFCEYCSKGFTAPAFLKKHIRVHTGERPFSCTLCKKSYAQESGLKSHLIRHLKPQNRLKTCKKENKVKKQQNLLNRNILKKSRNILQRRNQKSKEVNTMIKSENFTNSVELTENNEQFLKDAEELLKDDNKDFFKEENKDLSQEYKKESVLFSNEDNTDFSKEDNKYFANEDKDFVKENNFGSHLEVKGFTITIVNDSKNLEHSVENTNSSSNFVTTLQDIEKKCGVCQKTFKGKPILIYHGKTFHPNEKYLYCPHCYELFCGQKPLTRHIKAYHCKPLPRKKREKKYNCEFCTKIFSSIYSLKIHKRVHIGLRPFPCSLCKKTYASRANLRRHQKSHLKLVSTGTPLTRHLKNKHKNIKLKKYSNTKFLCNIIKRSIKILQKNSRKNIVKKEIIDKGQEKKSKEFNEIKHKVNPVEDVKKSIKLSEYQKEICKSDQTKIKDVDEALKKPSKSKIKNQNMAIKSSNYKEYKCAICPTVFKGKYNLFRHASITHPNGKALKCEHCDELFSSPIPLSQHMEIVHNIFFSDAKKKHVCKICLKAFKAPSFLKIHHRVHSKERPYPCPLCGKRFKSVFTMQEHQNIHLKPKKVKNK